MGFILELRSQEWDSSQQDKFVSELVYSRRNVRDAIEVVLQCIGEPQDANVYKAFDSETMDEIVTKLNEELAKTTPPVSKYVAEEYRELLKAIKDFKRKHKEDWDGMEFLYIYRY